MSRELQKNMEYLIKKLEKEWIDSKEVKKKIQLDKVHARLFVKDLVQMADAVNSYMDNKKDELLFKESMELTKRNYILLRIGKKVSKELSSNKYSHDITLSLDKEEYKLFIEYFSEAN